MTDRLMRRLDRISLNAPSGYHWTDDEVLDEKIDGMFTGFIVGVVVMTVIVRFMLLIA